MDGRPSQPEPDPSDHRERGEKDKVSERGASSERSPLALLGRRRQGAEPKHVSKTPRKRARQEDKKPPKMQTNARQGPERRTTKPYDERPLMAREPAPQLAKAHKKTYFTEHGSQQKKEPKKCPNKTV